MILMSDPAVVAGFNAMGIPLPPDLTMLDRHVAALEAAAEHHRQLAPDGAQVYRLASANQGPATDMLHARMTDREGVLPQIDDLHNRLTITAGSLRIAGDTIKWLGGVIAAAAVAALYPPFRIAMKNMVLRLQGMLRIAMQKIGLIFKRLSEALMRYPERRRVTKEVREELMQKRMDDLMNDRIEIHYDGAMQGCLDSRPSPAARAAQKQFDREVRREVEERMRKS
ncbi:hypothetical protein [Streptosporangium roseum]|uniref:hypothetical protein n=1 Tax=Streptosporangium roseum TaxID=2001 RepID=UPI00331F1AF4